MIDRVFTDNTRHFDAGLREFMLRVYNFMALGLLLTGITAFGTLNFPPLMHLMYNVAPYGQIVGISVLGWIITFAPIGIAMYFFTGVVGKMSLQKAQTLFWVYAGLMGMSLSSLGLMYTGASLVRTFFICASMFGAMSIYGYSTKKDLTSMGSFLIMGVIGLLIASVVNIFMQSSAVHFALSLLGVIIFMGLTAYDTQKVKNMYYSYGGSNSMMGQKIAIMGAFILYIDFINLYIYLLRFTGNRR